MGTETSYLPEHLGCQPDGLGAIPRKVFARPFRLTFVKRSGELTLLEVRSLRGLREVLRRKEAGEIFEKDGYSLELQLWGLLAEHAGFLRLEGSKSSLAAGIQPLGEEAAALADDIAAIYGGDEDAGLKMLAELRNNSLPIEEKDKEAEHHFVKPDGVNLTEAGEVRLAQIVGETGELDREHGNAVTLYSQTESEEEDVDTAIRAESAPPEGEIVTGPAVEDVGRRVEEAGMGELRADEEKDSSED